MSQEFDLVVLGGGTGGYVAAIRASQLGMNVAIVEKEKLGGTCLHRGCIPSKALLRSAEVFSTLKEADKYGVSAGAVGYDFGKIQDRKQGIIDQLHKGIQFLMKKGKIFPAGRRCPHRKRKRRPGNDRAALFAARDRISSAHASRADD